VNGEFHDPAIEIEVGLLKYNCGSFGEEINFFFLPGIEP
jgi:hypothetical protein